MADARPVPGGSGFCRQLSAPCWEPLARRLRGTGGAEIWRAALPLLPLTVTKAAKRDRGFCNPVRKFQAFRGIGAPQSPLACVPLPSASRHLGWGEQSGAVPRPRSHHAGEVCAPAKPQLLVASLGLVPQPHAAPGASPAPLRALLKLNQVQGCSQLAFHVEVTHVCVPLLVPFGV